MRKVAISSCGRSLAASYAMRRSLRIRSACLRVASAQNGEIENPRGLLYRVAAISLLTTQRRAQRQVLNGGRSVDDLEIIDETAAARQLVAQQRLALLPKAIAKLPPRCRECFVLRCFDDLSQDEVAQHMVSVAPWLPSISSQEALTLWHPSNDPLPILKARATSGVSQHLCVRKITV